jgi:cyclohexa-1,5-dienecarbonyl-CoA hydratase
MWRRALTRPACAVCKRGVQNVRMTTSSTQSARLSLKTEPPVIRLSLDNQPLNVIDIPMMEELAATLVEVESQPAISIIVFQGHGKSFSAGVDVAAHNPAQIAAMLEKFHAVIRAIVQSKKITVAVVHGSCLGGGAELALVCDFVITAEYAEWGFPEISLGCFPPVACTALAALVGQKRATDLILSGRKFDGLEALTCGIATAAVPEHQLEDRLQSLTRCLAQLSPDALAITKKAIYAWDSMHFEKGLARAEKIYLDELMKTEDAQEGIRAFLEKRSPVWKGR